MVQANRLTGVHVTPTVLFNVRNLKEHLTLPLLTNRRASWRMVLRAAFRRLTGRSGCRRTLSERSIAIRKIVHLNLHVCIYHPSVAFAATCLAPFSETGSSNSASGELVDVPVSGHMFDRIMQCDVKAALIVNA